ncbi:MAG TPA: hypothetical protein VM101_10480 [Flavitalea sp.]|nr:hypothetical protein [Flavitalea sp.]
MKQTLIGMIAFFQMMAIHSFAQSTFKPVTFKNSLRPSLNLSLTSEPKTTEETILAKLKETGYKPEKNGSFLNKKNKQEGFYSFSGVQLPELNNQKLDLYFRVDPVEGDSSFRSSISLMVSKGYENFVSPETDSLTFNASQNFLNTFTSKTEAYQLNKQLDEQKKTIATAEKKWKDLRDKQEDARKKIEQLQADMKNWQQEEIAQQKEVDNQRAVLQSLESKRAAVKQ